MNRNPLQKPSPTVAMSVEDGAWFSDALQEEFPEVEVLLFDTAVPGLNGFIGGMFVRQGKLEDDTDRWFVEGAAARAGYGPLLYDVAARAVGAPISPSQFQSSHAERFWGRRGEARIRNLSDADFAQKYGVRHIPLRQPQREVDAIREALRESYDYGIPLERAISKIQSRSNPYRAAIPIVSGIAYIANPQDLAGRHIPDRYLAGLPPALQKQRIRELTESRDAYRRGDFSELPTDVTARKMGLVKQSAYTTVAKERGVEWRGDPTDMATRILIKYGHRPTATDVRKLSEALRKVFSKGLAAWKSGGHRPGATAQNWAVARVNSVAVGGKAAWSTDSREFEAMPEKVRRTIQNSLDEVMSALHAQGRQRDVAYLAVAKSGARNNPVTEVEARRRLGSLLYPLIFRAITLQVASISRNTSSNITMQAKQELVQGAFEKAIQTVFDSVMYDEDSFSADNAEAEENLAEAAGLAKSVATKYIIDNARREVDPRAKTRQDEKADIDSTRRSLSILLGRAPEVEELAARLGRTADELQTIMGTRLLQIKHVGDTVRVRPQRSARLQEEQSGTGVLEVELIPDETIREREEQKEQMAQLQEAIEGLEPGERQIVRAYLGEIPARSLPYGPDELKRMVEGGYNQRTKSRDPGLMGKLATIVEERRLIEEKGVPRGRLVAR